MNCMNCGTYLPARELEYCPRCGANVQIQRRVDYLSKFYYNQGLEKAQIRDLSGAIGCLKQSLTYDKRNIDARNLLGLAYFETGEVVEALSEWVISKNLKPKKNLANDYIARLQANQNRLDAINETIRRYNEALELARGHHDDMAATKLKKLLTQNSKLIKGYHLLALIYMKNQEWTKARRILRKASRIDRTNTTTLRFLREIEEQIGSSRRRQRRGGLFGGGRGVTDESDDFSAEIPAPTPTVYQEMSRGYVFAALLLGLAAGALAFWMLAVPSIKQRIYREANRQIVRYSESISSQSAELTRIQGNLKDADDMADIMGQQLTAEAKKSRSYQSLFEAYLAIVQEDYDSAALQIQQVYEEALSDNMKAIYKMICQQTGVSGIAPGEGNLELESVLDENSGLQTDSYYDYGDMSAEESGFEDYAMENTDINTGYEEYDDSSDSEYEQDSVENEAANDTSQDQDRQNEDDRNYEE